MKGRGGKGRHLPTLHTWGGPPWCARCGLELPGLEPVSRCWFTFIPRTSHGRRSGWPRIRRELARLRRRGLHEENLVPNIVRGHARPWPEARDNREIRRICERIQRHEWTAIAGPGAAPPSTVSTSVLRYEDLVALIKSIGPQYHPPSLKITYREPIDWGGQERQLEISGHRLERIFGDYRWTESILLKPKQIAES